MGNPIKLPDPLDHYAGRPQRMLPASLNRHSPRTTAPLPVVGMFVVLAACVVLTAIIGSTVQAWWL